MPVARWDVEVLGLERDKTVGRVAGDVARCLGAETAQVERLLTHAPTTLVADLDEEAAKSLVRELRSLGVRVKPRPSGSDAVPIASAPTSSARASRPVVDDRATAPTESVPIPRTRALELEDFAPAPSSPSRSPLEHLSDASISAASGLELEDVAPPIARSLPRESMRPLSQPVSAAPERALPERPASVRDVLAREPDDEAPRVFWSALPAAFLVPLRSPVIGGLFLAPLFMGAAVVCSLLGSFMAIVGVLIMSSAFIGVTLQVAHRCLWATAVGERMPASLPSGFLSEYAFPGMGVVVVQAMIGGLASWVAMRAAAMGVPPIVIAPAMAVVGLYDVIGFALAAAGRSAMGFLDVPRIVRILVRAPLEVLAIALVGGLVQGTAIGIASMQIAAVVATGGGIGSALLALAGSTLVVSLAAGYGTALTATMMGMLFWARPEVANG